MSSSSVAHQSVPADPEHTQHAFAEQIHIKPMGSAEATHLITFLCQTESAKKQQKLLPPQFSDDSTA